jgi:hypothetical protein
VFDGPRIWLVSAEHRNGNRLDTVFFCTIRIVAGTALKHSIGEGHAIAGTVEFGSLLRFAERSPDGMLTLAAC